jgi:hypothetical protein
MTNNTLVVTLNSFSVSRIFRDKDVVSTVLISNNCGHRTNNICVVAIHGVEPNVTPCSEGCSFAENGRHDYGCKYSAKVSGNFSVSLKEKEGKLPVLHLNPTSQESNALLVDLTDGGLHDESKYGVKSNDGYYWEDERRSGGGSTVTNMLFGILPFSAIVRHYIDSYKGRHGSSVKYLKVTKNGLEDMGLELADGLELEDITEQ